MKHFQTSLAQLASTLTKETLKYKKHFFNPRKCRSAITLSGCIQRGLSKNIITLATSYSVAEVFEKKELAVLAA